MSSGVVGDLLSGFYQILIQTFVVCEDYEVLTRYNSYSICNNWSSSKI